MFRRLLPVLALIASSALIPSAAFAGDDEAPPPAIETVEAIEAVETVETPPSDEVEKAEEAEEAEEAPAAKTVAKTVVAATQVEKSAPQRAGGPPLKVYVCKYVGTPGIDEVAQSIINVSSSTLDNFTGTFPHPFPDAQGHSIAIGYSTGNDAIAEPSLADCPITPKDEEPGDGGETDDDLRLYVCTYVTGPGGEELAQAITTVDATTVTGFDPDSSTFPYPFVDAPGYWVAIGFSTGPDAIEEPSLGDCPIVPGPEEPGEPVEPDPDPDPTTVSVVTVVVPVTSAATTTDPDQVLPDTGATSSLSLLAAGALMVLAGATATTLGRRRG